jgi:hypothetical protein
MTRPPDQQPSATVEPPSHREVLALLRRHFSADVQVLEVRSHTVAGVRRAHQHTRPWRSRL